MPWGLFLGWSTILYGIVMVNKDSKHLSKPVELYSTKNKPDGMQNFKNNLEGQVISGWKVSCNKRI